MKQEISVINRAATARYQELTRTKLGRLDELVIPSECNVEVKEWGYVFFPQNAEKIDTLIIFVHSGIRVPDGFDNLLNIGSPEAIADFVETVVLNVDLGGGLVASNLLAQLNENPSTALVWYDYTRITGDPNRVFLEEQLPDKPFRGATPWSTEAQTVVSRAPIVEATIAPFFSDLLDLTKQYQPRLIISPHTYDPLGGGFVSASITDTFGETLRPAGMIFQENTYAPELGTLLSPEDIERLQKMYTLALSKISTLEKAQNVQVTIDEPYKIGLTLVVWLQMMQKCSHFMFEMRKDMFEGITDADLDVLAQLILKAR